MSAALIVLVLAAEGTVDALVGGVGLAVDAVGVDLEQDGDAVPGAAGDLCSGHARIQGQGHTGVPQVVGPGGERGGVLGGSQRGGAGTGPHGAVGAVLDEPAAHGAA